MNALSRLRTAVAATVLAAGTGLASAQSPLPAYVDLSPQQSAVQDQLGRDTCGTFATLAAVEAMYRRNHGLWLNLSEQYLNHWGQVFDAANFGRPLPQNENGAGSMGGGGMARPLAAMLRGLAVPPETALPYIPGSSYQTPEAGDVPNLNDWSKVYTQRAMDDFNLADMPGSYVFAPPNWVSTTIMPQSALDAGRYRATGVTWLTASEVNQVDKYRSVLASGREVIMEFRCCDGNPGYFNTNPWMLPVGSDGGSGGHVMLVVGYDDSLQMFRVKNSWGTAWANGGYAWVSYELVRRAAWRAAYLTGVLSPGAAVTPFNFRQYLLGRWQLNHDGWKGTLDIYNLPEDLVPGQMRNYRVGTLFMADGRTARVNGVVNGNTLDFFVDWGQPNVPTWAFSGLQFTTRMFTRDHLAMAGTFRDPVWGTFPAVAVKGSAPVTGTARAGGLSLNSYLGTWDISHDGNKGRVEITYVDPYLRMLVGRYIDINGKAYSMSGMVGPDTRQFSLQLGMPTPVTLQGWLSGRELGLMGGSFASAGLSYGFYGTRRP